MNLKEKNYEIAKWCATNIYDMDGELTAFIRNELNTRYYLLKDISALIWKMIINNETYDKILEFANKNGESQADLDNFLSELQEELLITDKMNQKMSLKEITNKGCAVMMK